MSNLWCRSAIRASGCLRSRRTKSSMPSLPPNLMTPAWDFTSADLSWNRTAAACGLPTTLHAAQGFISPYPARARCRRLRSADTGLRCGQIQTTGLSDRGVPNGVALDEKGNVYGTTCGHLRQGGHPAVFPQSSDCVLEWRNAPRVFTPEKVAIRNWV